MRENTTSFGNKIMDKFNILFPFFCNYDKTKKLNFVDKKIKFVPELINNQIKLKPFISTRIINMLNLENSQFYNIIQYPVLEIINKHGKTVQRKLNIISYEISMFDQNGLKFFYNLSEQYEHGCEKTAENYILFFYDGTINDVMIDINIKQRDCDVPTIFKINEDNSQWLVPLQEHRDKQKKYISKISFRVNEQFLNYAPYYVYNNGILSICFFTNVV
jgi:hypothetical protein